MSKAHERFMVEGSDAIWCRYCRGKEGALFAVPAPVKYQGQAVFHLDCILMETTKEIGSLCRERAKLKSEATAMRSYTAAQSNEINKLTNALEESQGIAAQARTARVAPAPAPAPKPAPKPAPAPAPKVEEKKPDRFSLIELE